MVDAPPTKPQEGSLVASPSAPTIDWPTVTGESAGAVLLSAGSVAGPVILVAVVALAAWIFARRTSLLFRLVKLGRPAGRTDDVGGRVKAETTVVLGQRKLLQRPGPGLMHAFIFWGFLVLLTTIVEALGQAIEPGFALPLIGHGGWLGLL